MKTERKPRPRGPAPAVAGPNLVVHDLKNLAGRLGLLLQNADERYADPLFKQTILDVLDDTAGHLRRLAHDLRDREGRLMVKLRVDLNTVLAEALQDTRPDLARDVVLDARYRPIPSIWADAFLLRCAFNCAIENALEAMGGVGTLVVSTATSRGKRVTVEIADTGPGMSPEFVREQLFRPFATTKQHGMGLGAYTFRQVAALHGGSVRIVSKPGQGTRARFHFPVLEH